MHHPIQSTFRAVFATTAALLAASFATAQTRVALCGAASTLNTGCQWTDVQTRLQQTGLFATVDIINVTTSGTGTPTLPQLLAYDALLCWTNSTPADNNGWGDVLADYVDAGGGVVVAVFANSTTSTGRNIGGRWQSGYEVILDQSGNASGAGGTLGTVYYPGHPLLANVTSFTGGTIGSRPSGTALELGAFTIAEWSDGKILVAQGANQRRVDLGFYPPNATCSQSGWATGGDQLMANALLFVATGGTFSPYGAGCAGTLGVPTLDAVSGSRPVLGSNFQAALGNLPAGVGFMVLGLSDAVSAPFTLPLDLSPFGMPGCSLLAQLGAMQVVVGAGTSATWSLQVPNSGALIGLHFYSQGLSLDVAANAAGITVSNAARGKLGT